MTWRRGANLVENGVVIALVAIAVLAIIATTGRGVADYVNQIACSVSSGASCFTSSSPSPSPRTNTLVLSPGSSSLVAGNSQSFVATEYDPTGASLGDVTSQTTFRISPNGSCTANSCTSTLAGTHTVNASTSTATGHATITFTASSFVFSIGLSPLSAPVASGALQTYTATAYDVYGNAIGNVTSSTAFNISSGGTCAGNICSATAAGTYQVNGNDAGHTNATPATLTVTSGPTASLTISPASSSVASGGSQTYTATGYDTNGNVTSDLTSQATFTIDSGGSCTANVCSAPTVGTYTVTATKSTFTATATLTINAGPPASIRITPSTSTVIVGTDVTYTATAYDANNNAIGDATNATTLTLTPDGACNANLCTATVPGVHTVTGTDSGDSATATLTVNAGTLDHLGLTPTAASIVAGQSQTYTATAYDLYGNSLGDVTSQTALATSSGSCAGATCTASTAGTVSVTAIYSLKTATATLTIISGSLTSISMSPASASLATNDPQSYTVTAYDAYGNPLGDVTASSAVTLSPDGTCALAACSSIIPGIHTVSASYNSLTTTATLTVNAGAAASIAITPTSSSISAGSSQAYSVTGFDAYGNSTGNLTSSATFSITPDGSCTLNSCTAAISGGHTITASYTGHSASASLTVTSSTIASITLSPSSVARPVGAPQDFTATGYDIYGNVIGDVTSQTTFSLALNGTCSVAACTATIPGGHTVTGNDGGITAFATLTITSGTLASITISPNHAFVTAGTEQAFSAVGFDQYNNPLGDVTHNTTFSITPDGSCVVAACAASVSGDHTVTGNDSGYTASTTLTVTASTSNSMTLSPTSASIAAGGAASFTATSFDQYGNPTADVTSVTTFTVSPNGSCTAAACTASVAGAHTVTGTDGSLIATANLSVANGTLDHILITPSSSAVAAGSVQTYAAAAYDSFNNLIGDVTNSTTFTLTPDGSCPATFTYCYSYIAGGHTVTGTYAGLRASAGLDITAANLNGITIAPGAATILAGQSQTYTATGFDTYGNSLGDVTATTTFAITPDGSCTLAACTASVAGIHTVTGTGSTLSGTATLTFTSASLNHITIAPTNTTIMAGGAQTYIAIAYDIYNNSRGDVTSSTSFASSPGGSCSTATCTSSAVGTYNITATYAGKTAATTLIVDPSALASITISPPSASIASGTSQTYSSIGYDYFGNVIGDATASTTFTITPEGSCAGAICSASIDGAHTITANDSGFTATATLEIISGSLASITLAPATATIIAGGSQIYSATGYDANGNVISDVTSSTTFSISPNGSCLAHTCSTTTAVSHSVTGTDSGHTDSATLNVNPAALDHLALTLSATSTLAGTPITYTSNGYDQYSNLIGDTTSLTTATVTGGTCSGTSCDITVVGNQTLTATATGKTGTATVTVSPGPLASITINPTSATILAGGSRTYTTTGFDAFNNTRGDVTVATTFSISPDGTCIAASCSATVSGTHTVTANDSGFIIISTLSVNAAALSSISINPTTSAITAGGSQAYTTTGDDFYGNTRGDVTSSTTFTITPDGSCTLASCSASVSGAHAVTATDSGHTATASLTFNAGTLNSITIAPTSATITAGGSQTFGVTGFDSHSNSLGNLTTFTTFSITPDGSCTAASCTATLAGVHTVTANTTYNTNSASTTASLTVNASTLASVTISPASTSFIAGGSQTYTAAGFDTYGNSRGDVTSSTAFTITPNGSCTVATCTASVIGDHTVTGNDSGFVATGSLHVSSGAPASITIAPASATITAGATQTYIATGFDSFSNSTGDVTAGTTFSVSGGGSCNGALCTATSVGAHTVTGNDAGKTATATLNINAAGLASITISPTSATITSGGSQTYTTTGFDAYSNNLGSATGATTFTITPNGSCTVATCTATVAGSHTVTATDSGHTATSTLTVNAGALASITISPASAAITANGSQTYSTAGFDVSGNPLGTVTGASTFAITPDGSCTVATCTASVASSHTVTATDSGHTATSTLTVNGAALDHLGLSPASATISAGTAQVYAVTGFDVYNNNLGSVTGATTFTIIPNGSCTTNSCTATVAGSHTVTGTDATKTGTATLTFTGIALNSITISPTSSTITADQTQTYVTTGFDTYGNPLGTVTGSAIFTITGSGTCTAAACGSHTPGSYTVTGNDGGHTATSALTVNLGALNHITTSPSSSVVRTGTAVGYTATGFDQYNNSLGNVTGSTTFTDTAGTCTSGASPTCTNSTDGNQTVTGNDSGHIMTAVQTSTTCTISNTTENYPGGARENTVVTFTANGGSCTGGLTPHYYFYDPAIGGSGWQAGNTYTFNQSGAGTEAMVTYVEVTTGAGNWPVTGGQYGFNYDWTTCSLSAFTLPSGVGTGPRWVTSVSSWLATATGSCTGGVTPSYDFVVYGPSNGSISSVDSGQLGNTATWNWATTYYPNIAAQVQLYVGIMSNNERIAKGYTSYNGSTTGTYLYWNGGAYFTFTRCTADTWTAGTSTYTPSSSPYNVTATQVGTCSAGATASYYFSYDSVYIGGWGTGANTAAVNYDIAGGTHTLNGYVAPLGDEGHWSAADANGGISGIYTSHTFGINNNCWGLSMTGAAGSANGNANVSVSASEACNPGTLQAFTYWWGQECNSPCPPPHCWTGLPGSSIGWGNGHPSETAGCWPRGLSTNSTSWTFAQSSNYTSCIAYNNPYYFMVVQNNYNPGVYLYSGIWAINVGGTCWPYGQSPW